jgi:hypothetical protein
MLAIGKTLYVSILLLGMPKIALAKYATIGNCPSCFDHQKRGSFPSYNDASNV